MQKLYGNVQGIKASQIKRLQEFYQQNQPADRFITPEFAQALATISQQIHHPICCYINRRGQIIRIAVGTPSQTQIPPEELPRRSAERLSGIRCVATQVNRTYATGTKRSLIFSTCVLIWTYTTGTERSLSSSTFVFPEGISAIS